MLTAEVGSGLAETNAGRFRRAEKIDDSFARAPGWPRLALSEPNCAPSGQGCVSGKWRTLMRAADVDKDRMLQVADHWRKNDYYGRAEQQDWLNPFWSEASPFRTMFMQLDGACMVDLACGHGRHA